ncbi:helix-turn-helix transcriptional regulator [Fodinicola feengrottensis]|uniref:Helix-turn-helix transcriptional regulator n=1 Tax=Fodinicola feengrottensis TaxID=435914 RepID=A0ABN2FS60_9ACTN
MAEATPRTRRLGALLKQIREDRGWSQAETAAKLGYKAVSTVSKIENGTQALTLQQLPHVFLVYELTDTLVQEELRDLVRRGNEPDYWERYGNVVSDLLNSYLVSIDTASRLFVWNPGVIHGLLQTPDYARAIAQSTKVWTDEQLTGFVDLRLEHQEVALHRQPPLQVEVILTEGILRQEVGGRSVMRAQVHHLVDLAHNDPNITIQVIPFSAGAHAGVDGPFMYMTFPGGRDQVSIESTRAALQLTSKEEVEGYRNIKDLLQKDALTTADSTRVLASIAEDLA